MRDRLLQRWRRSRLSLPRLSEINGDDEGFLWVTTPIEGFEDRDKFGREEAARQEPPQDDLATAVREEFLNTRRLIDTRLRESFALAAGAPGAPGAPQS